jgi:hypothetical protein
VFEDCAQGNGFNRAGGEHELNSCLLFLSFGAYVNLWESVLSVEICVLMFGFDSRVKK